MRNLAITIWLYLLLLTVSAMGAIFFGSLAGALFASGDKREAVRWLVRCVFAVAVFWLTLYQIQR